MLSIGLDWRAIDKGDIVATTAYIGYLTNYKVLGSRDTFRYYILRPTNKKKPIVGLRVMTYLTNEP